MTRIPEKLKYKNYKNSRSSQRFKLTQVTTQMQLTRLHPLGWKKTCLPAANAMSFDVLQVAARDRSG